jgi:hypothetical protein
MTKLIPFVLCLATAACATGNPQQRQNVIDAMGRVKVEVDKCYELALARNRRTPGGVMFVEFTAAAGTGQFVNVLVRRDQVRDPVVRQCVVANIMTQKMEPPPTINLVIPYELRFTAQ